MPDFFSDVPSRIPFGGLDSSDPLSFKVYDPNRMVLGKRMEDHLRPGVCFWHSFAWAGVDMFGLGTLDRPWLAPTDDEMAAARQKMAVAFEFFTKLGTPYYCFHDRDVAPEGDSYATFRANLDALADDALGYQEQTGVRLLWDADRRGRRLRRRVREGRRRGRDDAPADAAQPRGSGQGEGRALLPRRPRVAGYCFNEMRWRSDGFRSEPQA